MAARKIKKKALPEKQESEIYLSILSVLSDKRLAILSILVAAVFFAFMFGFIYKRSYTASVYIYPGAEFKIENAANPVMENNYTIFLKNNDIPFETYAAILRSPQIQLDVLQKNYSVNFKYKHYDMDLMQYFSLNNITYALQELNDITEIDAIDNSGVMKISVTTQYPDLSQQIAESYVNKLEEYLEESRQQKIEDEISMLNETIQAASENTQVDQNGTGDLVTALEKRKAMLMIAKSTETNKLGSVRSAYISPNNLIPKPLVVILPLAVGLIVTGMIVVQRLKKYGLLSNENAGKMGRVMLKRGPESAPEKVSRRVGRKSDSGAKSRTKRTAKV
ncbi:MAG: hypothetical protein GF310_01745 [candidate division Zixibacteria bacterium]|nr:hypothetical protein [candidate division Zixibacteria bacterium]